MKLKILIISADFSYKDEFQKASLQRSIIVEYAKTMAEAIDLLIKTEYCLVIIRADTVDYLSSLNAMSEIRQMPILVISYKEQSYNAVAIKNGTQILIITPYSMDYLAEACAAMARYYANIKNQKNYTAPTVYIYKYLLLIAETHQVFYKETKLRLTKKEFDLLKYFMANKGATLTYEQIHNNVWGYNHMYESTNLLHSLVHRVRQKLPKDLDNGNSITSVWEVGYKFGADNSTYV